VYHHLHWKEKKNMFQFVHQEIDFSHKLDYASSPKDEYSKHMHSFYELLFFVRGDVDYHVESETRHLKGGDIILMNPGKYHFANANHNVSYERYVLKFPTRYVPESLADRLKNAYPFFSSNRYVESIVKGLDGLYDLFNDGDMYLMSRSKIVEILVYLANVRQGSPEFKNDDIISTIIDYIQGHLQEGLTLESIANDLHYSELYLSNQFKKTMRCSLMKYIRSKKIILAQALIKEGKKAIDVAEELGFNDYSTFYRTYVKITGVSPAEDRAN